MNELNTKDMKLRDKFKEQTGKSVNEYMNYAKEHYPNSTGYAYIQWLENLINKNDLSGDVIGSLPDDALHFAEWMDIVCIRENRFKWKYNADNYEKVYTTKDMFNEWKKLVGK